MDGKVLEGVALLKEAEKALKTSLFKWKEDWSKAASCYDEAGKCFRIAKAYNQAMEAFKRASHAHQEEGCGLFHAGRQLENAAAMAKELREFNEAANLFMEASRLLRLSGSTDAAATVLSKAARIVEDEEPERGVDLYLEAIDLMLCDDDKEYETITNFKRCVNLLAKHGKLVKCAAVLDLQEKVLMKLSNWPLLHKLTLSRIILCLKENDFVGANKSFTKGVSSIEDFIKSDECKVGQMLLDAIENRDSEAMAVALKKQVFTFLENEMCKVARTITFPGMDKKTTSIVPERSTTTIATVSVIEDEREENNNNDDEEAEHDDDDDDEGLC